MEKIGHAVGEVERRAHGVLSGVGGLVGVAVGWGGGLVGSAAGGDGGGECLAGIGCPVRADGCLLLEVFGGAFGRCGVGVEQLGLGGGRHGLGFGHHRLVLVDELQGALEQLGQHCGCLPEVWCGVER
ncbi:hypothetical protein [Salinispora cortesiana]|uniref:hypothetical protein n=1 Tax=Salinispora cortesiana TaxID=1305843 RepID=UPI0012BD81BF|nr:hypothetical protein [Salinispora cortesiana]